MGKDKENKNRKSGRILLPICLIIALLYVAGIYLYKTADDSNADIFTLISKQAVVKITRDYADAKSLGTSKNKLAASWHEIAMQTGEKGDKASLNSALVDLSKSLRYSYNREVFLDMAYYYSCLAHSGVNPVLNYIRSNGIVKGLMLSEKKEPVKYIKGLSIQVINLMRQGKEKSAKKLYKKVKNLFEKKKRKRKDHPVYLEAEYLAVNDWGRRFSISEYLILCSKYNSLYLNYKGIAAYHINMQEVSKSLFERSHKLNTKYKPAAINYNLANQGKPPVFIIKTPSVNKWEPEPVGFLYPVYAIMFTQIGMKKPNNEAKLYVSVKPVDAKIEISGISEPFYQGMELAPGTYNIKVSKDSYVAKNREIVLSSGERKNLKIKIRLKELANSIGMKFVWIPEGCFQMGSDDGDSDEKPVHEVCVDGYYMAKYEVTQGQWQAVMGTCPWSGKEYVRDTDNNPAVYVSWNNAQKFIKKVNNEKVDGRYRLPTEAEWEYACRAGSKTRFYFGGSDKKLGDYAWYGKNTWDTGEKYAHKVGSKKPNAWGLYDMHGNVWEWCEDLYDKNGYSRHSCKNPLLNYWGFARVLRGGSWYGSPWNVRSAGRIRRDPSHRYHYSGFRLVLLPGSSKPRQMYSEKAEKDGFCIEKDGFCIEKDGFCINKK